VEGKSTSDVLREVLDRQLGFEVPELTAGERAQKWIGVVNDPSLPRGAAERTELDQWAPDRRG